MWEYNNKGYYCVFWKERAGELRDTGRNMLPLGKEESAEVELLPPKSEDIFVVVVAVAVTFFFKERGRERPCDRCSWSVPCAVSLGVPSRWNELKLRAPKSRCNT
jgi:hypothetical protein